MPYFGLIPGDVAVDFLAQKLNSRDLLALLFIAESSRKKRPFSKSDWDGMLAIFADRLQRIPESMRFEVLEAHLMSVEDIDIYDNASLSNLLKANEAELTRLKATLDQDSRFAECP